MSVETSAEVTLLFEALAKAQNEIETAKKDAENPHFKRKYADLASVWSACRTPLTKNGLAIVQLPERTEAGVSITTMLTHSSGQWVRSTLDMPLDRGANAQTVGAAITYGRRYALAAVAGVAPDDDDDGNSAAAHPPKDQREPSRRTSKAAPKDGQRSQTNSEVRAAYARYVVAAQKLGVAVDTMRSIAQFIADASGKTLDDVEANEAKWNSMPDRVWMKVGTLIGEALAQAGEAKHQRERKEREPGEDNEWDEDPTVEGTAA